MVIIEVTNKLFCASNTVIEHDVRMAAVQQTDQLPDRFAAAETSCRYSLATAKRLDDTSAGVDQLLLQLTTL